MNPRVLIVDDSLTVRMDLEDAMRGIGIEATSCADLASARRLLRDATFDLIVLDVILPDGDGVDFLRVLKGGLAPATMPITAKDSYTVVQKNAYAVDSSVAILMLFPITTCSAYDAMQKAKAKYNADALINVTAENIYNPYFFYSVQKIVVRGDAIKFKKSGNVLE